MSDTEVPAASQRQSLPASLRPARLRPARRRLSAGKAATAGRRKPSTTRRSGDLFASCSDQSKARGRARAHRTPSRSSSRWCSPHRRRMPASTRRRESSSPPPTRRRDARPRRGRGARARRRSTTTTPRRGTSSPCRAASSRSSAARCRRTWSSSKPCPASAARPRASSSTSPSASPDRRRTHIFRVANRIPLAARNDAPRDAGKARGQRPGDTCVLSRGIP